MYNPYLSTLVFIYCIISCLLMLNMVGFKIPPSLSLNFIVNSSELYLLIFSQQPVLCKSVITLYLLNCSIFFVLRHYHRLLKIYKYNIYKVSLVFCIRFLILFSLRLSVAFNDTTIFPEISLFLLFCSVHFPLFNEFIASLASFNNIH